MTYTPTPRVEIAFGFGPYDLDPLAQDWIDVTDHVMEVTTHIGRENEFELFPAGTATVTLLNDDREFDPLNTAGPYYGNLVANTPIRIIADHASTDYPIWRGFVDGWPATYTAGGFRSEVKVRCTDAFRVFAERPMGDTFAQFLQLWEEPTAWYRFETLKDQVVVNDRTVGKPGRVIAQGVDIVDGLNPNSDHALSIPSVPTPLSDDFKPAVRIPIPSESHNLTGGSEWSISFWFTASDASEIRGIFDTYGPDGLADAGVFISSTDPAGRIHFYVALTGFPFFFARSPAPLCDGLPHHIVCIRFSTSLYLYVDGVIATQTTDAGATAVSLSAGGNHYLGRALLATNPTPAFTIDDLMAWDRAISETEVADLYEAMTVGASGAQAAGTAIGSILDQIGWPVSLRDIDVGEAVVELPVNLGGRNALELMQNIARCEGGRLFVAPDGTVTFHTRSRFLSETVENTVQYTFSDVDRDDTPPPDVGLRDDTLSITVDDRVTFDAAEVTRVGGQTQRSALTATPARTYSTTGLLLTSDNAALSLAQWYPFRYATPQPRSEAWEVDPEIRAADWADILSLGIGHRIRHTLTPGGIGSALTIDQHVSVIGHRIDTEEWILTLNGTPVDPNEAAYFLWATTETADDDNGWADTDGDPPGGYWG